MDPSRRDAPGDEHGEAAHRGAGEGSPEHVCLWVSLQKLSAGDGI